MRGVGFCTREADIRLCTCSLENMIQYMRAGLMTPMTGLYWFGQESSTGAAGEGFASGSEACPSVRQAPSAMFLSWLHVGGLR